MALARIITRSHACSRELALDLLARGYTVEIVSPEAIPDSLADLELRVDNAGDQLVANVTAHDGDRSTSLEFLHHLKAPMGDFIRRVPEIEEVPSVASPVRSEAVPVGLGAGDSEVVLPAVECSLFEERAGSRLADPVVESAIESGVFRGSDEQECVDTPSIGAMGALDPIERVSASSQANEIPVYFEQAEARRVQAFEAEPLLEAEASPRTASRAVIARFRSVASWWGWRVALTFATVVVLALLLGFGLRRTGKAVAQSSSNAEVEKIESVPNTGALIDASVAGKDAANNGRANTPLDQKVGGDSDRAASRGIANAAESQTATTANTVPKQVSRGHDDGFVARDTVTYLDDRYKPVAKTHSAKRNARRHPAARRHSGEVVAANKVTYLDKPAPKPAK